METVIQPPIELVCCEHCHLVTPAWRTRCIHCRSLLTRKARKRTTRSSAESDSAATA